MRTDKIKNVLTNSQLWIFIILLIAGTSCNNAPKNSGNVVEEEIEVIEPIEVTWIIDEHQYHDIPLTSKAEAKPVEKKQSEAQEEQVAADEQLAADEEMLEEEEYEIVKHAELQAALAEQEYEQLASTVEVTEVVIPLEETQTVVAYAKKEKNDAVIQVVTNLQTGEVEQITFMDEKHTDVYDVQAGMSGKEVRKLRRELKHMVKKGQVFLYDDQSNIMYLMDAKNMVGDEITAEEVETMDVQAIVWKDKKHHKKDK